MRGEEGLKKKRGERKNVGRDVLRERGMEGKVAEWQRAQRAALCLGESSGLAMRSKETGGVAV